MTVQKHFLVLALHVVLFLCVAPAASAVSLGSASGAENEHTKTFSLPSAYGTIRIAYEAFNIPDSFKIYVGGVYVGGTGMVSGSSTITKTINGQYGKTLTVVVNDGGGGAELGGNTRQALCQFQTKFLGFPYHHRREIVYLVIIATLRYGPAQGTRTVRCSQSNSILMDHLLERIHQHPLRCLGAQGHPVPVQSRLLRLITMVPVLRQ